MSSPRYFKPDDHREKIDQDEGPRTEKSIISVKGIIPALTPPNAASTTPTVKIQTAEELYRDLVKNNPILQQDNTKVRVKEALASDERSFSGPLALPLWTQEEEKVYTGDENFMKALQQLWEKMFDPSFVSFARKFIIQQLSSLISEDWSELKIIVSYIPQCNKIQQLRLVRFFWKICQKFESPDLLAYYRRLLESSLKPDTSPFSIDVRESIDRFLEQNR